MASPKLVFIDTNTWISCCDEAQADTDYQVLEKILKKLSDNQLELLLPDVVALEYKRKVASHKDDFLSTFERISDELTFQPSAQKQEMTKITRRLRESIAREKKHAEANFTKAQDLIDKIFENSNVKTIPITPEHMVKALSHSIGGMKPYKQVHSKDLREMGIQMQPDVLIIEALASHMAEMPNESIIICSANLSDFAEESQGDGSETKPTLHKDIGARFSSSRFYPNVGEMLNVEFQAKIPGIKLKTLAEVLQNNAATSEAILDIAKQTSENMSSVLSGITSSTASLGSALTGAIASVEGIQDRLTSIQNYSMSPMTKSVLASIPDGDVLSHLALAGKNESTELKSAQEDDKKEQMKD